MRILLSVLTVILVCTVEAQDTGKFFPTFFIKYGSTPQVTQSAAVSAKFDMVISSTGYYNLWSESGMNSWKTLKKYNPDMVIAIYQLGPSEYNTSGWGVLGDGWDWIRLNHGSGAGADRWTGSGHKFDYLANVSYPNERCMYLGHPGWQAYWVDKLYEYYWINNASNYAGVDAIFSDNTFYKVAWANNWYEEGNTGVASFKDHPKDYSTIDGIYDNAKYKVDAKAFFNFAVPRMQSKAVPIKIIPNFGYMGTNPEYWSDLDTLAHPPFAAMEEGSFVNPWSKTYNMYDWLAKVNAMKKLKNVAAVMNNIGKVPTGTGLAKMDVVMTEGNYGPSTGWEVLWYTMNSFLLALNESKTNGYYSFNVWGYGAYYWLDEYDPQYLHLGKPLADYYIPSSGAAKDVAFREYEDGWVVANVSQTPAKTSIPVPSGKAYIVTHSNLRDPYSGPLVTSFNLGKNRGVILLKEGKRIGNEDNIYPVSVAKKYISARDVVIYPNPCSSSFTISGRDEMKEIMVTNILGKKILQIKPGSKVFTIDASAFPEGMYIIHDISNGNRVMGKVLKKNAL